MPRKYSGPLQPGKRSAYVRGTRKRKSKAKPKLKAGLNKVEKHQIKKMIKGLKETYYINTIQYAFGQGVETTLLKAHLAPKSCFQSANRITMIGLATGEDPNTLINDVNNNSVYTSGDRMFLTGGVRAKHLNGVPDEKIDGDMAYMKSHLQRVKIHAKAVGTDDASVDLVNSLNFRVLVVQTKGQKPSGSVPSFSNTGTTANPSLFRDKDNVSKGIDDQITTPFEFTNNLRVDTQAFKVIRDIKFRLSNPIQHRGTDSTVNTMNYYQYPATKEIDLWLPQPKKPIQFDDGTDLPTNYDYRFYTLIFCSNNSTYNSSQLGTTEDRWFLESTSIARLQEY